MESGRKLKKEALPSVDLRERSWGRGPGPRCTRWSSNSVKVFGRPSAALAGRGARAGPQPGRRRGGVGGPQPRRAPGSVGGEARPAFPAALGASACASPAHNTSHVCATHPPSAWVGGARAGGQGAGSRGKRLRARTGQWASRRGTARAGRRCKPWGGGGGRGAWRSGRWGRGRREGRGLLLGLAQETRRRGRSYWLPVWAACLLLAGEL